MITPGVKVQDNWDYKRYIEIFCVLLFSAVLNIILGLLELSLNRHFTVGNPVVLRSLFDFLSIIVAFSIFLITFYTYYQNSNLRLVVAGFVFLVVAIFDSLSQLTYLGLPKLSGNSSIFGDYSLYWMLSILANAIGFVIILSFPEKRKSRLKRIWSLVITLAVIIITCVITSLDKNISSGIMGDEGLSGAGLILLAVAAVLYAYNIYKAIKDYRKSGDTLNKTLACAFIIMFFNQILIMSASGSSDIRILLSYAFKFIAFLAFFNVFYINGIRRPYSLLSEAKEELNGYTYELDRLVDKRTHELKQVNKRLMADMEAAKGIQRSILPESLPQNEFVAFVSGYIPAENLSGDFYNVFKIDDTRYGVYLGDVSGHGISAAMLTIFTFQKIQSLMEETGADGMSVPSTVLKHLYDSFNAANFSEELYIVLLYGVYNIDTGIFSYASGGLNTAPLRLRPDGSVQELDSEGYAILKLGDLFKPKFSNHQIMLFPGDKLVLYTDGLIETVDSFNTPYSKERLKDLVIMHRKWNARHLTDRIIEDVTSFSEHIRDDITILTIDVLRPF